MISVRAERALAALLIAGLPAIAAARPLPRLAIVGIESPPYLSGMADEIAKLAVQAGRARHQVVGPDEVHATLGSPAFEQLGNCKDDACRAALLRPLGEAKALGGSLSQNETSYLVDLWLIDVPSGRSVARLSRSILIASRRLETDLAEVLPKLVAGRDEENGELAVRSTPAASLVTVDDVPLGGGTEIHRSLEPGKHHVVVQADGYLTTERWVQIAPGQIARLDERLVPTSGHLAEVEGEASPGANVAKAEEPRRYRVPVATWVLVAVSAAALGTGLYFGVSAGNRDHQAGQFDGNGVDQGLTRAQALQGQTEAAVANGIFIGAGVAFAAAIVIAVVAPGHAAAPASAAPGAPAALSWSFP